MINLLGHRIFLFWQKAQALEVALYFLIGAGCYLGHPVVCLFIFSVFIFLKTHHHDFFKAKVLCLLHAMLLVAMGFFYTFYFHPPSLPKVPLKGDALVKITEKKHSTFFGTTYLYYKCHILNFKGDQGEYFQNIPGSFTRKMSQNIDASKTFYVDQIELIPKESKDVRLKFLKNAKIVPIENSFSLAEWRYKTKLKVERHLSLYVKDAKTLKFLLALSLGYLDNKTISFEFSKVGVQHLLTISGFHFALLAMMLSFALRLFLPRFVVSLTLITLLTMYVIYLGSSPSVSRAWIAIILYLSADLLKIKAAALNSLGCGAIIAFLENPLCITHMGFQFSYLATFGIIAFYSTSEKILSFLIPKRSFQTLLAMPKLEKILYYILNIMRKALALDFAVNTLTIPLVFYHFGSFPYFSFFYNLLIPFLVSGTLILLIIGLSLSPFPFLASKVHMLNTLYTKEILAIVSTTPAGLDKSLFIPYVNLPITLIAMTLVFLSFLPFKKLS